MTIIFSLLPIILIVNYKNKSTIFFYLFIIFLILVAGLRFPEDPNNDTHNYFAAFETAKSNIESLNFEPAYSLINVVVIKLNLSFQWVLIIMSCISILSIAWAGKRCGKNNYTVVMFFYLLTYYFSSFNAMRQFTGISILILGYTYLKDYKVKSFLLCVLFACLFHLSCFIALVCFLFYKKEFKFSSTAVNCLIILSLIIGSLNITPRLLGYIEFVFPKYIGKYSSELLYGSSFSFSKLALSFLFIYLYSQMNKSNLYLKIVFIGIVMFNLMSFSGAAMRIAYCFTAGQCLLYAIPEYTKKTILNETIVLCYTLFIYYYMLYFNISGILDYKFCDSKYIFLS